MQDSPDQPESSEPPISDQDAAELMRQAALDTHRPATGNTAVDAGAWVPPLPEELAPLLSGYTIISLLGRGGMGAVYRGLQDSLEREVAIKLLPPELGQNPEFEARFQREAKSMAKLNHPNIVQIYDYGQTSAGHHYIVMEFVDGTDLHQLIHSQELTSEGALNAISQICDALEFAHSEGFVHRDIKPANMFITSKGILKVGDFGLAKLVEDETNFSAREQMGLTMTGVAMGTPHYIAPEQLQEGAAVDQRADIYSLGIMFYEMLTGEIPRGAVKSPSEKAKSLDVRIDGVVFKAMESDPVERYQSAIDLRTDVDIIRTSPTTPETTEEADDARAAESSPPSASRKRLYLWAASVGVPFLLVGGLIVSLSLPDKSDDSYPSQPENEITIVSREEPISAAPEKSTTSAPPAPIGALHGLVYDQATERVIPISIPSSWKSWKFKEIGSSKAGGDSAHKAFNWWAIKEDGTLFTRYNEKQMVGLGSTKAKLKKYDHKVGVTVEGELITEPRAQYANHPEGNNYVDARMGGQFGIALTSEGDVRLWPITTLKSEYFQPPSDILRDVAAIETSLPTAMVLSNKGVVTQWHSQKGIIQKFLTAGKDVIAIDSAISLNRDGTLNTIGYTDLVLDSKVVDFRYGSRILALKTEKEDWRIVQRSDSKHSSSLALIEAFEATAKGSIIDLEVNAPLDGYALVIWLEESPDANGKVPTQQFLNTTRSNSTSPVIRGASVESPFINSLGMPFVPIPIVGGKSDGKSLLFSAWETRVSDYQQFIEEHPDLEWLSPEFEQEPDHPAVRMPWPDAVAFCEWLTKRDREAGLLSDNEFYRLPTDHEWSCAAGIGHLENPDATPESKECRISNLYPWGSQLPPPNEFGNYYGEETAADPERTADGNNNRKPIKGFQDPFPKTSPVGSFPPNEYGLYDLSGNALEWTSDWYSTMEERKALRGSSWGFSVTHALLISGRVANSPTIRFTTNGFRCVLDEKLPQKTRD
ncbi:MAG: bifunctional serine/threonine-protein kinase/formylglycine-generating enzyme family protein [Verrucomicrobiota bacterium]